MRVAVLSDTQGSTPTDGAHGLGRVMYNLVEGLIKLGHDVTLFGTTGSHCSGATITPVPPGKVEYETVLAAACVQEHKAKPFDAIWDGGHTHVLSLTMPNLPVINHYNDKWQPYGKNGVVSSNGQKALMVAEDEQFAGAKVLHNAHDAKQFIPSWRADDDPAYLVYCGAIIWYKQPLLAIEAASRMRMPLIMLGNITGGHGWLDRDPIHTNVKMLGAKYGQERDDIIRGATAFLQLGHSEAGPMAPLESALLATPIVAWPSGGNLDLIKNCENGVFINLDIEDKVDAVIDGVERARGIPRKLVRESTEGYFGNLERFAREAEHYLSAVAGGATW